MQVEQIDRDAAEYYGTAIGYPEKDPSGDILRTAACAFADEIEHKFGGRATSQTPVQDS